MGEKPPQVDVTRHRPRPDRTPPAGGSAILVRTEVDPGLVAEAAFGLVASSDINLEVHCDVLSAHPHHRPRTRATPIGLARQRHQKYEDVNLDPGEPALPRDITLAETRDRERLHVLALVPDALAGLSGVVRPDTIPALR